VGKLGGKTAIVTGAGQGVGLGIALALASEGADIVAAGRTLEKVERAAEEIRQRGVRALALGCDVGRSEDIDDCVSATLAEFGTVDILVNNAQMVPLGTLLKVTDKAFEGGFRTGPLAALRLMRACHPHLKDGGAVVNIGTGSALRPDPVGFGAYAAVKEATRSLTRAAACEWGADGIRVNSIIPVAMSPGMAMWAEMAPEECKEFMATIPLGRGGDPETDVGRAVAFLCGPDASYITGTTLMIDGGHAYLR
jgi:NAD(P)-dependent dehydrogenase (short-subunit alcohol dehydrogenase family)